MSLTGAFADQPLLISIQTVPMTAIGWRAGIGKINASCDLIQGNPPLPLHIRNRLLRRWSRHQPAKICTHAVCELYAGADLGEEQRIAERNVGGAEGSFEQKVVLAQLLFKHLQRFGDLEAAIGVKRFGHLVWVSAKCVAEADGDVVGHATFGQFRALA